MNSHIPMLGSVAECRVEEHLANAERARMLRQAGRNSGAVSALRRFAGNLLVRAGERLAPAARPAAEPVNDQALIRLAR